MYHKGGYTLVHKHVYRVYSAVLCLQIACMHNPNSVCAFLTCTCTSVHTCSAYTRALHGRFDVIDLVYTHRFAHV